MFTRFGFRAFSLIFCFILTPRLAVAQTAALSGNVTDQSGAVVAAAAVTATNTGTGLTRTVQTGDAGGYVIPLLPPGAYVVQVRKDGFRELQRDNVQLAVDTSVRLDLVLDVGDVQENVAVTGAAPLLQDTASIGTGVTRQEMEQLPLIQVARNRTPAAFVFLAPGVRGTQDLNGTDNVSASNHVNFHGGQIQTNEFWIEGLPAGQSRLFGNFNEAAPSVDAISEFRVQSSQLSAEYGMTGAGVTSFSLKAGTNKLHGAAYEYLRHQALDAKNPFATEKARTQQNEFGGSIGGPLRRDRTFFFASYGASRRRGLDILSQTRIPTPANLTGDFSDLRDSRGALIPIYDPATTRVNANGVVERTPFPGNIIPRDRFDPAAAKIASYYPAPNASGTLNLTGYVGEKVLDPTNVTVKVDHALTSTQRVAVSAIFTHVPRLRPDTTLPEPLMAANRQLIDAQTWRVNHTAVLSSSFVHTAYAGYNRFENEGGAPDLSTDWPSRLGIPEMKGIGFPSIAFGQGYSNIGQFGRSFSNDHTWMLKDQLTWLHGRHEVIMGAEVRQNMFDSVANDTASLTFSNRETADPSRIGSTGDPIASFLLGQVSSASISAPLTTRERRWYYGAFVSDTWRVNPELTITAGLRWDVQTPPYEADDLYGLVDLSAPNPGAGNIPGAVVFAGDGEGRIGRSTFADTDYSSIGPRIGFAWRPTAATVVRGGYGIYYTTNDVTSSSPGFRASASPISPDNGLTPAFILSNGFTGIVPNANVSPTVLNGQNGSYLEQSSVAMPRLQNWSIGIQRDLGKGWMAEANYVGVYSTRLSAATLTDINQVDPQFLSLGALLTRSISSPEAVAAGIRSPYPGFTGTVAQALRAFPQYQRLTSTSAKLGESTYHGVELRLAKRLSNGLSFQGSYTWSRNHGLASDKMGFGVTENGIQNAYDVEAERAVLPNDIPHAVVFNYTYELPFGEGRRWLNGGGVGNALLGGWTVAGIHRYQSGYPIPILMTNSLPIFNRVLRPDLVSGVSPSSGVSNGDFDPAVDRIVNLDAFTAPAAYAFGSTPRAMDDLRQFAVLSENLAITKRFPPLGGMSIEFYAHVNNLLNRVRFVNFDNNFSSASFGRARSTSLPRFIQLGARVSF
jgi:hypothetical protein